MQRARQVTTGENIMTAYHMQQHKVLFTVLQSVMDIGAVGFDTQFMGKPGSGIGRGGWRKLAYNTHGVFSLSVVTLL
jgi:hypothetical protein